MTIMTLCNSFLSAIVLIALLTQNYFSPTESNEISIDSLGTWNTYTQGDNAYSGTLAPLSKSWDDPSTEIFVGMSHYRDRRCSVTVANLLSKAKYPERIHIGIMQQVHTEKDGFDCVRDYCRKAMQGGVCKHKENIHKVEMTHQDARGPSFARYMQQSLINKEEFCMQVDAHVDVVQDWDVELTRMWAQAHNEYAILSTALPDVSTLRGQHEEMEAVPHLCQATVDKTGAIVNLPPTAVEGLTAPLLSPLLSAGFSFSKCHAEMKVPYDPQHQMIFEEEELVRYARLWTRGYDVYTPHKSVVGHDYQHTMASSSEEITDPGALLATEWMSHGLQDKFVGGGKRASYEKATQRIATLLGYPEGITDSTGVSLLTRFGLGTKRTLDQFIEFTGIDTRNKRIFSDRCKKLDFVPFEFDTDIYTVGEDVWGSAPEALQRGGFDIPLVNTENVEVFDVNGGSISTSSGEANTATAVAAAFSGNNNNNNNNNNKVVGAAVLAAHNRLNNQNINNELSAGKKMAAAFVHEHIHRGGELWWIFQFVDTFVEYIMNTIDTSFPGHGHKMTKLLLLGSPIFVTVLLLAIWSLLGGGSGGSSIVNGSTSRIHKSPVKNGSKGAGAGAAVTKLYQKFVGDDTDLKKI